MSTTFPMRQGDRLPVLEEQLSDRNGVLDLTTAVSVKLQLRKRGQAAPVLDAPALFVEPRTSGTVRYEWAAGDTAKAGTFLRTWEITFPEAKTLTVPSRGDYEVVISPQTA